MIGMTITTGDWLKSLGNNCYTNPNGDILVLLVGSDYSADLSVIRLSYQDVIGMPISYPGDIFDLFLDAIGIPMSFDDWLEVLHNVFDVIAYH